MSALPPKADIAGRQLGLRFVPKEDSCTAAIVTTAIAGDWEFSPAVGVGLLPGGSPHVAQRSAEA